MPWSDDTEEGVGNDRRDIAALGEHVHRATGFCDLRGKTPAGFQAVLRGLQSPTVRELCESQYGNIFSGDYRISRSSNAHRILGIFITS